MSLIGLRNIYKVYDQGQLALKNINLTVDNGDFISIMGPSGSGKTTLLKIASTMINPSAGEIIIGDKKVKTYSEDKMRLFRREKFGFVFQDFKLLEEFNVRENIILPLVLNKISLKEIEKKLLGISSLLKIDKLLEKNTRELSGGEKQKVAIARALIHEPIAIFADEPTGRLEFNSSKNIMELLKKINKELNTTIFMVTHDAYVASYSERVLFLRDGEIYNQIDSGEVRGSFYKEILDVISFLGGKFYDL